MRHKEGSGVLSVTLLFLITVIWLISIWGAYVTGKEIGDIEGIVKGARMVHKSKKRVQTTFLYCPKCNNELVSSNSFVSDEELVTYKCSECGLVTTWSFDPPVPILIDGKGIR